MKKLLKNKVIGYVLGEGGYYMDKYYFKGTAENMARFVMQFQDHNCIITDSDDELILTSFYGFLDKVLDQSKVRELQKHIVPYQLNQKELVPMKFVQLQDGVRFSMEDMTKAQKQSLTM